MSLANYMFLHSKQAFLQAVVDWEDDLHPDFKII